jgi:hypothetical protein
MEYLKNLEKEILLFEEATGNIPDIIIANTNDIKDILPSIEIYPNGMYLMLKI